jgi:signal transduction histidine kinase
VPSDDERAASEKLQVESAWPQRAGLRARAEAAGLEQRGLQQRLLTAEADLATRRRELHEANRQLTQVLHDLERRSVALEDAQAAKDRFIATPCHELRNPPAAIQAAVEVMSASDAPLGPVEVIGRQARALVRMTDDLLDVSRSLSGKMLIFPMTLDLREIIDEVIEDLPSQQERRFRSLMPDQQVTVKGDPIRLAQLVRNLLDNAYKFTIPGGIIEVKLSANDTDAILAETPFVAIVRKPIATQDLLTVIADAVNSGT